MARRQALVSASGCLLVVAFSGLAASGCDASSAKAAPAQNGGAASPSPGGPSTGSGFYDTAPFLASVRPALRADLAKIAGVSSLDELPKYDLDLKLDFDAATFELVEVVSMTNRESKPMDEVVLRIYANSSEGGTSTKGGPLVELVGGECSGGVTCKVSADGPSTVVVSPDKDIAPGGHLTVKLSMKGRLEEIDSSRTNLFMQSIEGLSMLGGGESASFGILAKGDDIASMANFYAVLARRRDGAWEKRDDSTMGDLGSDDMSHVHARVDVAEKVRVTTTGIASKDEVRSGRRIQEIDAGMVRDFAVIASDKLEVLTAKVGDVEVRSHFLPAEKKAGEKVLDVAKFALEDYEKRFGTYPYADLDVVEAPLIGGAGGVEFAGLVTIASMFYRPAFPTDGMFGMLFSMLGGGLMGGSGAGNPMTELTDKMLEFTTAHEVAHQYWHGLVGSDSRLHPFQDESLAQFTSIMYLEDRYGKARAKQDGDMNVAMNYKTMRMLGKADAPADRSVSAFGDMLSYAGLVYGKAPYLWVALRDELGDEKFFKAVQGYVADNRLKMAKPGSLIDALAKADPAKEAKVRELAKRWLEEAHGDEDLGSASLFDMLGPALGMDPSSIDPKLKALIEKVLKGATSGGAGGPDLSDLGTLLEMLMKESL